ncbi:MAG: hypothetical protein ABW125_20290, partial [Candidatus Thiodiazotropha lotti]
QGLALGGQVVGEIGAFLLVGDHVLPLWDPCCFFILFNTHFRIGCGWGLGNSLQEWDSCFCF